MSRLFSSGGQSIRASVLAEVFPVLPMNIQGWFPLGLTGLTVFSYHNSKASILQHSTFFMVQLSDLYMITGKTSNFDYMDLCQQSGLCFFNMLSRFVIFFLPRSKLLLILRLQSLSTLILEPKKIKSVTVSTVSPSICHEVKGKMP